MNKKLIAPIVTIAATFAMAVGTTYAMFTRNVSKTVDVTSGKIDVSIDMTMSEALSRYLDEPPFDAMANAVTLGGDHEAVFELTGTGDLESETLTLERIAPTDQVTTKVSVTNASNISIKWRYGIQLSGELIPALDIKLGDQVIDTSVTDTTIYQPWSTAIEPSVTELIPETNFVVTFPDDVDNNDYQGKTGQIKFLVETVQGNMEVHDPTVTKYGFHDSYLIDEGLETEHWVHEVSTVSEFRNIVTNEGNTESDKYPGYEDPHTEFVIINDVDLGGDLWTDHVQDVTDYIFTGTLRAEGGAVLSNYSQTQCYDNANLFGDPTMGLFNGSICATFKDLTLSNFSVDNSSGKVCGLLTAGWSKVNQPDIMSKTGCEKIAAEPVLFYNCENIYIDDTCSMNISANGGSLIGQARQVQNLTFKNCYSAAYINGNNGANIGGLVGSSSVWSQTEKERTYVFEDCTFAGTIITNGANIGGLSAQISVNNAKNNITVKNCDMAGNLLSYYNTNINNMSGIYISNLAKPTTLATYPTLDYINDSFTGTFVATLKQEGVSGYNYEMSIDSIKDFYNQVIPANLPKVEMGFDANNRLEVTNKEALIMEYDSVLVQIKTSKNSINIERATDDAIKNSPTILFNKEYTSLDEMESASGKDAAYKITRLGYFLPTENTQHPTDTKGETSQFEYFMMDYSHKNEENYANGYHVDASGAYFIKHNDNASVDYIAFGNTSKNPSYFVVLMKDGVPVAHGDLSKLVSNVTPYGA